MRVFSFSDRICPTQKAGGPGGVNYRLFIANEKYRMFLDMYHVFSDLIIEPQDVRCNPILTVKGNWPNNLQKLMENYNLLNEEYGFSEEDIFLFHEVESALAFSIEYPFTKTVLIYHQQGSLYYEYLAFGYPENEKLEEFYDMIFREALNRISVLAFPSIGAREALVQTEPSWKEAVEEKPFAILYNGCDCEAGNAEKVSDSMDQALRQLETFKGYRLATVAALNYAKGVERIPEYLAKIKAEIGLLKWVVVGDGPQKDKLAQKIKEYGMEEDVIWIQETVTNDEIMELYRHTDYYIMAHRFSIFDFATIEAMALGNIPLLTKVGGNLEMIQNNGAFIEEFDSVKELFLEKSAEDLKQQNIQLATSLYSEYEFLNRYRKLCDELEKL